MTNSPEGSRERAKTRIDGPVRLALASVYSVFPVHPALSYEYPCLNLARNCHLYVLRPWNADMLNDSSCAFLVLRG